MLSTRQLKHVISSPSGESDEYDDIYVSYEGGTYVLYVDGRPQADGPQSKMIQLAKQEERMRG